MALVLIQKVVAGEYGLWLTHALASQISVGIQPDEIPIPFKKITLSRADLASVLHQKAVKQLTDEDIHLIAQAMGERGDGFWEDVISLVLGIVEAKK